MDKSPNLKSISLGRSALFFGIPMLVGFAGLYLLLPALKRAGVPLLWNYTISFAGMFPLLLAASLAAFVQEGHTLSWTDLRRRFRIYAMGKREWLWTAGLLVAYVGGQILL